MTLRLILAIALLVLPYAGYAEDWSRFRGPNGSGVSKDTGFPTEFGPEKNVVWRSTVRPGKSSPVLTSRHVFLTGFENGKLYTQCFDRKTGKLLWERAQDRPREELGNVRYEPAAVTPVTDGDNVYVFFGDFGLISYDLAGKIRWKAPLGPFTNYMGMASSPILAGDDVVLVADQQDHSYIASFDRRNGEIRWKTERSEKDGWASPVLLGGGTDSLVLTVSRGEFGAHRVKDGTRAWTLDTLSPAIVASPILVQDTLFTFGYGNDSMTPFSSILTKYDKNNDGKISPDEYGNDAFVRGIGRFEGNRDWIVEKDEWDQKQRSLLVPSKLLAFRLEHGERNSIRPVELWRYEKNFVGVIPSPLFYQDVLYIIRNGGILTNFDARTGEVLKTGRVQGAIGGYSASPVAADGRVYLASEDGKVAVLKADRDWEVLAVNDLGESCFATPALSEGSIYLRSAEALYRFAKR